MVGAGADHCEPSQSQMPSSDPLVAVPPTREGARRLDPAQHEPFFHGSCARRDHAIRGCEGSRVHHAAVMQAGGGIRGAFEGYGEPQRLEAAHAHVHHAARAIREPYAELIETLCPSVAPPFAHDARIRVVVVRVARERFAARCREWCGTRPAGDECDRT